MFKGKWLFVKARPKIILADSMWGRSALDFCGDASKDYQDFRPNFIAMLCDREAGIWRPGQGWIPSFAGTTMRSFYGPSPCRAWRGRVLRGARGHSAPGGVWGGAPVGGLGRSPGLGSVRGLGRSPGQGIGAEPRSGDWGGAPVRGLGRSPGQGIGAEPRSGVWGGAPIGLK